ncbi:MAG: cyclic nucleotide-binding domain-containing protein [Rhodospirillaceae bacterium]|nr:cyclic nucleotide-binding domain-containing protein [Rhodospirillales bacterium]
MSIDETMNGGGSAKLERVSFAAGERIFSQGDAGDAAYILQQGRVTLFQHHEGHRIEVGDIVSGEIFGEMAVLDGGHRSASAVAAEDCVVARVPQPIFLEKLAGTDRFIKALMELFIKNIRNSPKLFLRRPRSFRDHVKQMSVFSWNMRRFAGRMSDNATADDVLDILDRLDGVLGDLANVAEQTPDKRHDLIIDEELNGVEFSDVIGTEGRRRL